MRRPIILPFVAVVLVAAPITALAQQATPNPATQTLPVLNRNGSISGAALGVPAVGGGVLTGRLRAGAGTGGLTFGLGNAVGGIRDGTSAGGGGLQDGTTLGTGTGGLTATGKGQQVRTGGIKDTASAMGYTGGLMGTSNGAGSGGLKDLNSLGAATGGTNESNNAPRFAVQ
jgi:hypothetical protein